MTPSHRRSQCSAPGSARTAVEETLNRFLDGELPLGQQPDLFSHLAVCSSCRASMEAVMSFRRIAREEYIAVPQSADEMFMDRLADLKVRVDRVDRAGDRQPLWQSRTTVSLGTTVFMAACLFLLGFYVPRIGVEPARAGSATGEQEMVDLDAAVFGVMNTIYILPGLTVESPRFSDIESP
ncbi:MAG: anti-sigma factor RsiW [Rhodothermales bacterium]|jgi:anti-sigma factor RsiW